MVWYLYFIGPFGVYIAPLNRMLSPKEQLIYQVLEAQLDKPLAPTFRDVARASGFSFRNTCFLLDKLRKRGLVTWEKRRSRSLRITQPERK